MMKAVKKALDKKISFSIKNLLAVTLISVFVFTTVAAAATAVP